MFKCLPQAELGQNRREQSRCRLPQLEQVEAADLGARLPVAQLDRVEGGVLEGDLQHALLKLPFLEQLKLLQWARVDQVERL